MKKNFQMLILTGSLVMGLPLLTWAQTSALESKFEISFPQEAVEASRSQFSQVLQKAIALSTANYPTSLHLPKNLKFAFSSNTETYFEYVGKVVNIKLKPEGPSEGLLRVLIHEMAHAALEDSAAPLLSAELNQIRNQFYQLSQKREALKQEISKGTGDMLELSKAYEEVEDQLSGLPPFLTSMIAFHEFFADSVTAIISGNPNSSHLENTTKKSDLMARDFSTPATSENIAEWKKNLTLPQKGTHYAFGPARWALWPLIQNQISTQSQKSQAIEKVMKATLKTYVAFFKELRQEHGQLAQKDPDVSLDDVFYDKDTLALNQRLIEQLHLEFKGN